MEFFMSEENKKAIILHRIFKSKQTIEEAQLVIDNDKLRLASNRIYYSIFYIISALGLKYDFLTSKQKQLLGWFNFNFVKTGKVSVESWRIYKDAFDNRQESDYLDFVEFKKANIEKYFDQMVVFVSEIEKLINEEL